MIRSNTGIPTSPPKVAVLRLNRLRWARPRSRPVTTRPLPRAFHVSMHVSAPPLPPPCRRRRLRRRRVLDVYAGGGLDETERGQLPVDQLAVIHLCDVYNVICRLVAGPSISPQ